MKAATIQERIVHTGQHYDHNMSSVFFDEMELVSPTYHLHVGSGLHGQQTAQMLSQLEAILIDESPDAVLVYGDTNSTLAGALAAGKLHIPVIHVEAGLRSYNRKMPEEINRVLTDHLSTILFCPTPLAMSNLALEGIREGAYQVGDVMKDAVNLWTRDEESMEAVRLYHHVRSRNYYLATIHRAENTDDADRFQSIVGALNAMELPVLLPAHPRIANSLRAFVDENPGAIRPIAPVGYAEMLALTKGALAVLTDSGGLQKESYMLQTPCITLRDETEWIETVEAGWNSIVGADPGRIVAAVRNLRRPENHADLYGDGKASKRMAELLVRSLS
jgi:UDP-N-acetylglucosamine 2-epimerase